MRAQRPWKFATSSWRHDAPVKGKHGRRVRRGRRDRRAQGTVETAGDARSAPCPSAHRRSCTRVETPAIRSRADAGSGSRQADREPAGREDAAGRTAGHAPGIETARRPEAGGETADFDRGRTPSLPDRGKPNVTVPAERTPPVERPATPGIETARRPEAGGEPPIDRGRTPSPDRGKEPNESVPAEKTPRVERPVHRRN